MQKYTFAPPKEKMLNSGGWMEWWQYLTLMGPSAWPIAGFYITEEEHATFPYPEFPKVLSTVNEDNLIVEVEDRDDRAQRRKDWDRDVVDPIRAKKFAYQDQASSIFAWILASVSPVMMSNLLLDKETTMPVIRSLDFIELIKMVRGAAYDINGDQIIDEIFVTLQTIRQRGKYAEFMHTWQTCIAELLYAKQDVVATMPIPLSKWLYNAMDPVEFKDPLKKWLELLTPGDYQELVNLISRHYKTYKRRMVEQDVADAKEVVKRRGAREHDAVKANAIKTKGKMTTGDQGNLDWRCKMDDCLKKGQYHCVGGHVFEEKAGSEKKAGANSKLRPTIAKEFTCFHCHEPGHKAQNCPSYEVVARKPAGKVKTVSIGHERYLESERTAATTTKLGAAQIQNQKWLLLTNHQMKMKFLTFQRKLASSWMAPASMVMP